MPVTVKFDPQAIYSEIQSATDVSMQEMLTQIIVDTDRYVPMSRESNEGHLTLRNSVKVEKKQKNEFVLSYSRPVPGLGDVAESLYHGYNPRTGLPVKEWTTPGTGEAWMDRSIRDNLQSWIDLFAELTREKWRERKQRR